MNLTLTKKEEKWLFAQLMSLEADGEMKISKVGQFYTTAKKYCIDNGAAQEIEFVTNEIRKGFEKQTAEVFFRQFMYVVINSGMKNQIAEDIYKKAIINGLTSIGHPGKRRAIQEAWLQHKSWFEELKTKETVEEKLEFLETLPWIKYRD
jgi:hypothetical protein